MLRDINTVPTEVDIAPAKRGQFAALHTDNDREPGERAQSGSIHASFRIRPASSGDGGRGFAFGAGGVSAKMIGFTEIQPKRTARFRAPLMMKWICRIVAAPSGLHACGRQRESHSCWCGVRWSVWRFRPQRLAAAQLGLERVECARVEGAELNGVDQRVDVLLDVPDVRLAGAALPGADFDVLVQELVERRVRVRLAALVDLAQKPRARLLGELRRARIGRIVSTRSRRLPVAGSLPA